jgi:AcrR family transcriptional regulator
MSWKQRAREARGYHHGNLKEALIQAALELIREKGPAGFTFADAARWAGVSPAAPYRHFRDREALLADVAREGFQRFEAMLSTGWANGKPDAITAFHNVGRAYLAFARSEPAFYAAMFESGLPPDLNAELRAAGDRAFAVLRTAAETLVALLPANKRPPALMMSLHVWAMAHGIASLFGRGDAGRRTQPMSAEDLLESEMLIYLQGLGFPEKA